MFKNEEESFRTASFKRNTHLEDLLNDINQCMWLSEKTLLEDKQPQHPLIFIMGPLRSGTTLFMQWLSKTGIVAYPSNLLSRFYNAPILASKIQLLLTDEKYNFRDELGQFTRQTDIHTDFRSDFRSENGKTKGVLEPNEFWYFWRRFLPFAEIDYLPDDELFTKMDISTFRSELAGMVDVFNKPFALKGIILNYNIPFLNKLFDKAIFIHIKRDPLSNIASVLEARQLQLGGMEKWYSFKIPEYAELVQLPPHEQVAGQIYYSNKAVQTGLSGVPSHKKMTIEYEAFCENPAGVYTELLEKLRQNGFISNAPYHLPTSFSKTRKEVSDKNIEKAYKVFYGENAITPDQHK